jgi:hypothetical protein
VLKLGILELMVLHMKMVNTVVSYDIMWHEHTLQFTFFSQVSVFVIILNQKSVFISVAKFWNVQIYYSEDLVCILLV